MNRKLFLQNAAIIAGASILPSKSVFSQQFKDGGIDKLTDSAGNFIHQPLPYRESLLEPYMDEETLHLHYTFTMGVR